MIILGYARKAQDLALFTRHLAGAMLAKAPLSEIVASFAQEADTRQMQQAVLQMRPRLESGAALSQAISDAPHLFPPAYVRLIKMGEESQTLPRVVENLAATLEQNISLHESFRRAAVYPTIVLCILFVQSIFIINIMGPKLGDIMRQIGNTSSVNPLWTTPSLIAVPFMTLLLVAILWLLGTASGLVWSTKRHGSFMLSIPLIGPALRLSETARFVRHLGLMLENRIPMSEALGLLADSSTNGYVRSAMMDLQFRLSEGEQLRSVIGSQTLFPASLAIMLGSAQERGQLHETLLHLSDFYQERTRHSLRLIREFFEPLMLILVGFLVTWVALSIYLPILSIPSIAWSGY